MATSDEPDEAGRFRIECWVTVPDGAVGTVAGEVVLTVEDVTLSDVPAPVVARSSTPGPVVLDRCTTGPFPIEGPVGGGVLSLRVTVDVDGDGIVGVGDLLSTRRQPVRPGGQVLVVPLTLVG